MWQTRLWLPIENAEEGYLVEPEAPGPKFEVGMEFYYNPGEPPLPEGTQMSPDQRRQQQANWEERMEPVRGQWFVDHLYWELVGGHWIQNVVLDRNKPRETHDTRTKPPSR
jgi:hypothetical protein